MNQRHFLLSFLELFKQFRKYADRIFYLFLIAIKILTANPDGYNGEKCSTLCPSEHNKSRCRKTCNCQNSSCYHVNGCNSSKGKQLFLLSKNIVDIYTKTDFKYIVMSNSNHLRKNADGFSDVQFLNIFANTQFKFRKHHK